MKLSCLLICKKHFTDIIYDNIYYYFDLTQWIDQNLFYFGYYEKDEVEFVRRYLDKSSVFFDVGANSGIYSLVASKICSKVFSFEPDGINRRRLNKNILLNRINNIKVFPYAVSDKSGISRMYIKKTNRGMNSLLKLEPDSRYTTVKKQTLDQIVENLKSKKISLIKMDIEGSEFNAIKGANKTITKFRPAFLIEINKLYTPISGYEIKDIYNFFYSYGYRPYLVRKGICRKMGKKYFLKIKQQNVVFEYFRRNNA